jgi:HlyD family secretion protein
LPKISTNDTRNLTNGRGGILKAFIHMRTILIILVVLVVLIGGSIAVYQPVVKYWQQQSMPKWRTAEVAQGDIVAVVNSTGTVKPVLQVTVGSFVSGPIEKIYCEFNQEVKKGDLMAKIDPLIYQAAVDSGKAQLVTREATVLQVQAQLQQAMNDEKRALALRSEDVAFIAQSEIDKFKYGRIALDAQVKVAQAAVEQAQFELERAEANLKYTDILAPVDGIVINRKIDPGQTIAAQFQTPELFIVAPDMRVKMHVHASVDEADIGLIKKAQIENRPVSFTVDAYPDDLFHGAIEEIRLSSTETQNVVTYPVIVAAPNPELKLLPGMTPSISFEVDRCADVVKIPNSALRFFPDLKQVREADKTLIEGQETDDNEDQLNDSGLSAEERAAARKARTKRHVWVQDGFLLRAVEVYVGLSDSKYTQLVSGNLKPGDKLIIGIEPPKTGWGG